MKRVAKQARGAGRSARPEGKARVIRPPSLHSAVVGGLRDMIENSDLPPGSKINEAALCDAFGISRTPLREALKVLAAEGLVELRPRRGAVVAPISRAEIAAVFEVMAALESLVGELACRHATDEEIAELERMQVRLVALHRKGSRAPYYRLNRQIHNRIVALTRNPVLAASYRELSARIVCARALANFDRWRWQESVDEHELIMEALRARDPILLASRLEEHNRLTGEAVVAALGKLELSNASHAEPATATSPTP